MLQPVPDVETDVVSAAMAESKKAHRARLRRREKLQRIADAAVEQWTETDPPPPRPHIPHPEPPVERPLPRPPRLAVSRERESGLLPPPHDEGFTPGRLRTVGRIFSWLRGGIRFLWGEMIDRLLRRHTQSRSAVRLRETFESLGTTFIKLGQQLSMRLDILPYVYCNELERMFDRVPEMPYEEAVRVIEEATARASGDKRNRKPLEETFAAFDPKPIGSASVACVYHAVLKSGEHVAVKVRRPGIGDGLAADMLALRWLLFVAELIFLRPGLTKNFSFELSTMLMEELDFRREARFAELFRRRTRKTRDLRFASAPKVYFDHSTNDVLVTEYVTGVWVTDVLTALEMDDDAALQELKAMNIDPVILARRIQLIARFNNFENIFFHADLHPANILIRPGNKITLIDFGSCGSFSRRELNSWRRWFDAQAVDDVGGMAHAAMAILEPVPPSIDKDEFSSRLEMMFWNDLYAIKSKHSPWSERISARLWMGFISLSREYGVPMRLNTLRMIRASMLADTIAGRLDHDMDPYREFRYYEKRAGRRAKKRLRKQMRRVCGPSKYIRMEQLMDTTLKFIYQMARTVDSLASIRILPLLGKVANAVLEFIRALVFGPVLALIAGSLWAVVLYFNYRLHGTRIPFATILLSILQDIYFLIFIMLPVLFIHGRRIKARIKDRDYQAPQ